MIHERSRAVSDLPLVGAELQRISSGFASAADELTAARRAVLDVGTGSLGTPECATAIENGLRDLAAMLARLEATASACVPASRRLGDTLPS